MKKLLTMAVASAVVLGTANAAMAAANPFSDVPADHWSYDAVAELAEAGVIDGYGDGSFRGDKAITRYEMAQMVARAMARDVNGDAKATLDKLAAEYADELNNLGVRVSNLEKKVDNVKFSGYYRMQYTETKYEGSEKSKGYPARLRLNMTAKVNDDWKVNARLENNFKLDKGADAETTLRYAYAQGPLFGATAKLGKISVYSADDGMIVDAYASGAQFGWSGSKLNTTLTAAVIDANKLCHNDWTVYDNKMNYQALEFNYKASDKLGILAAYHHANSNSTQELYKDYDDNSIWELGFGYKFDKNLKLSSAYAKSSVDTAMADGGDHDASYTIDLNYKGAKAKDKGSFGAYVAYRNLSDKVTIAPTYDVASRNNIKGWEIGTGYTVAENIVFSMKYFDGKEIGQADNRDYQKFWSEIKFLF